MEFGYALALGKPIVLIGERANIFHYLAHVRQVDGAADVPAVLAAMREGSVMPDLVAHLAQQRAWSARTFGPGARTAGVVDHIRRELREIEAAPGDLSEWVDVVLLALDGAWRAGHAPESIASALVATQARNEARTWPDWRTADPDKAIEHSR